MSVSSPEEPRALQRAGRVVAATIRESRPGVTTAELDGDAVRASALTA